ncbi:MAG: class I SAM-dependent methyltransferase [Trueperaceae bacterium]|nr:class I SAM-dependent methyltransferase [Trueperaceae bacterium]
MNRFIRPVIALSLLSLTSLFLEISFTRVLSALLIQSYVFLVLSLAVLGISLGAALVALFPRLAGYERLELFIQLAALSTLVLALFLWWSMGGWPLLLFFFSTLPYVFIGITLAGLFITYAPQTSLFYGFDLLGAGLGVLLAVPLLNAFGGFRSLFLATLLLAIAGILLGGQRRLSLGLGLGLSLVALLLLSFPLFQLDMTRMVMPKPLLEQVQSGAEIQTTSWDAFSRTDLIYKPAQDAYYLYMDGGAGSVIPDKARAALWGRDIGQFPFLADHPQSSFLIGPGGGLDVALAKKAGSSEITVVEVNRESIALVRNMADYTGDLYGNDVTVFADEGRSVLKRQKQSYDLIFLSQVITQAAEARAYVLAENKLYTTEAFHDYLEHLNPGGQIALKLYDELTLTRAFLTAVKALSENDMTEAEASQHLFALLDTSATPAIPLLIVKKEAIAREEAIRLARVAEAEGYAFLYIPGLLANPPLDGLATGQLSTETIVANATDVNLRPVTDKQPFFYHFEKSVPLFLHQLMLGLAVIVGVLLLVWVLKGRGLEAGSHSLFFLASFVGLGFMAIELIVLQQTQLLLGHPSFALSVTLGTLLVGSGLGSLLSKHLTWRSLRLCFLLIAFVWLGWFWLWPIIEAGFLGSALWLRALMTCLSLLPLAFLLGLPFPLLLNRANHLGGASTALTWSLNGLFSVIASVGVTTVALMQGYSPLVYGIAGLYLAVGFLTFLSFRYKKA